MLRTELSLPAVVFMLTAIVFITGCASSIDGRAYENQTPAIDLGSFFEGKVKAWGIVQNRSGNIIQRFTVDIIGTRDGNQLVLDETFEYQVGEGPTQRTWTLEQTENGVWRGKANDIDDQATGKVYGNAFNLVYQMEVPVNGRQVKVTLNDWFWLMDKSTLINRSYIRKFGLTFAEISIFMQRQ